MKKIFGSLILVLAVFIGNSSPLLAQKLTIYTEEVPPYNFTRDNKIVGVSTEVVEAVMKESGLDYEMISYPWARTYKLAKERPNSLIFSISRRASRETIFKWIDVIVPSKHSVFVLQSRTEIRIDNLVDMKKYRIGTTLGDARETYLLDHGFEIRDLESTVGVDANSRNYKKLKRGRIDLWPMPDAIAYYTVKEFGDDPNREIRKAFVFEEMSRERYYIAANLQTSDKIVEKLRDIIGRFKKTPEYKKILETWGLN